MATDTTVTVSVVSVVLYCGGFSVLSRDLTMTPVGGISRDISRKGQSITSGVPLRGEHENGGEHVSEVKFCPVPLFYVESATMFIFVSSY